MFLTQFIIAFVEMVDVILEDRIQQEKMLETQDISILEYLQIAEQRILNNIIALNFDEFN